MADQTLAANDGAHPSAAASANPASSTGPVTPAGSASTPTGGAAASQSPTSTANFTAPAQVVHKPGDPEVEVTIVFQDRLKHAIHGLTVKAEGGGKSEVATTDVNGVAIEWQDAKRGEPINIFVKKRDGTFDLKMTAIPKRDVNNFTVRSPEYHIEAITRLDSEQQLEEDLHIPVVREGDVMTVERLTGEMAPYIASKQIVTESGKVIKETPATRKKTKIPDPATGKIVTKTEIEHHYKFFDAGKPSTVAAYVLGSRLNYPKSIAMRNSNYEWMQKELNDELVRKKIIQAGASGIELAAIKAVSKQEAGDGGFLPNGLPKILFERHIFFRLTAPPEPRRGQRPTPHPYARYSDICNPNSGGFGEGNEKGHFADIEFDVKVGSGGQLYQYERFVKAALLNRSAAIQATSWGAFQVLADYSSLGYSSAEAIANSCMESIDGHCKVFVAFLKSPAKWDAIPALYHKDWEAFAAKYNGANWRSHNPQYANNLRNFYAEEN